MICINREKIAKKYMLKKYFFRVLCLKEDLGEAQGS